MHLEFYHFLCPSICLFDGSQLFLSMVSGATRISRNREKKDLAAFILVFGVTVHSRQTHSDLSVNGSIMHF